MKGRSFDTFQVASGNQEAYTACRRIALMEEMGPTLVVLLGPEGCGKSHLLWAIAKQVRVGTLPAGLALITPDAIPDKVRGLVEESRPLQGRRAILLVDGLDRFDTEVRRLDAIIETFLAHQHPVVIATNVHPNRLGKLSVPLVNRLSGARFIAIEGRLPEGEQGTGDRVRSLEEAARDLQRERDALQEQVSASEVAVKAAQAATQEAESHAAALQRQVGEAVAQLEALQASLTAVAADKSAAEARVADLRAEADEAHAQCQTAAEALQEALAGKVAAESKIAEFQDEADYALAQQARLQGKLTASRLDAEEATSLRASLTAAEQYMAEAVETLGAMHAQHAVLCEDLQTDLQGVVKSLDTVDTANTEEPRQEIPLLAALSEATVTQQQIRDVLSATRERLKGVEFEWEKTRKILAIQTAEMDALRYETASQVAQASIQAGELEHRIGLLESAFDSLRATRPVGDAEDSATGKTWSMALENMQVQLAALHAARSNSLPEGAMAEQALFESDFFEALPADFDVQNGEAASAPLPGLDNALKDVLEDALGGPQEDGQETSKDASIDTEN